MPTSPPVVPAARSTRTVAALDGDPRTATVAHVHDRALYLLLDGTALPVVASGGLRLPTALWLADPPTAGWGVDRGTAVVVGGGEVRLPGATLRTVRSWRPAPVATAAAPDAVLPADAVLGHPWRGRAEEVSTAAVAGDDLDPLVRELVGSGPGLTPSGDDVLCGLLLALRLRGRLGLAERVWAAVAPRLTSTTSLSAALLAEARDGYAVPPVVELAAALVAGDASGLEDATARTLAVGHSSGSDLLAGFTAGLDATAPALAGGAA